MCDRHLTHPLVSRLALSWCAFVSLLLGLPVWKHTKEQLQNRVPLLPRDPFLPTAQLWGGTSLMGRGRGKGNTQDHQRTLKDPWVGCGISAGGPHKALWEYPVPRSPTSLSATTKHGAYACPHRIPLLPALGLAAFTCGPESAAPEPAQVRRSQKPELLHHLLGNKRKVCNPRSVEL